MEFNNITDVKKLMNMISNVLDKTNEYYDDFKWFSNVNYTTTTEYYGELRNFLKKIIQSKNVPVLEEEIQELYNALNQIFSV